MPLPTKKTEIKKRLEDYVILVYGRPKIGKSTFCAGAENAIFLATDVRGLDGLSTYNVPINSWEEMKNTASELKAGGHNFKTIIIDMIDTAYILCSDYVCRQHNIPDESSLPHGMGWRLVRHEFIQFFAKLGNLPYGIILTSHCNEIEITTPTRKFLRMVPSIPNAPLRQWLSGFVGVILYCDFGEIPSKEQKSKPAPQRIIRTNSSDFYDAGIRPQGLGIPDVLPLRWDEFKAAWEGKK
jgi:hypothetical protein